MTTINEKSNYTQVFENIRKCHVMIKATGSPKLPTIKEKEKQNISEFPPLQKRGKFKREKKDKRKKKYDNEKKM